MPTILEILGWRLFFYSNEGNEPIHIHARKAEMECKFWIKIKEYDIEAAYTRSVKPRDAREIRKIIFDHFEYIIQQWDDFQKEKKS